jgi:hypothetical protein
MDFPYRFCLYVSPSLSQVVFVALGQPLIQEKRQFHMPATPLTWPNFIRHLLDTLTLGSIPNTLHHKENIMETTDRSLYPSVRLAWGTPRAGHKRRQFDESTMNLSIDIVDGRLLIGLRNSVVGLSFQN